MFGPRFFGVRYYAARYFGAGGTAPPPAASDIRQAVVSLLTSDATLAGLVGSAVVPMKRPQRQGLPCLEYQLVSNPRGHWLVSANGVANARFQFDCWSYSLSECVAIKTALENVLDGYSGTVLGIAILWSKQIAEHDLHEWATDGSDTNDTYRIAVDYWIKHRVSIPSF